MMGISFSRADWLERLAERRRDSSPWIIVPDDARRTSAHKVYRYSELSEGAMRIAVRLRAFNVNPGDPVAVVTDNSVESCLAIMGVLACGAALVPVAPRRTGQTVEARTRDIRAQGIEGARQILLLRAGVALPEPIPTGMQPCVVNDLLQHENREWIGSRDLGASDVCLIQRTSGTTGKPTTLRLSHGNILHNISAIAAVIDLTRDDIGLCWLPMFHDMGLVGSFLTATWVGMPLVLMTPVTFFARPESWLWAISRFGATVCAAPNSAYQLCSSRIPEHKLHGLDLKRWRVAFNGSELVHPSTLEATRSRFAPYGFRGEAMLPCYGLAESAVAVTISDPGVAPSIDWVDRQAVELEGQARPGRSGHAMRGVVCVGAPLPQHSVRVLDGETQKPIPDRMVGEIQVTGPSVRKASNPRAETANADAMQWLSTGDRGYLVGDRLYVVGRSKQVIKRYGRTLDASEIATTAELAILPRRSAVAVFGVANATTATEDLVVMIEAAGTKGSGASDLLTAVRDSIRSATGVSPDVMAIVSHGTVPRTSSGKVQHNAVRELFLSGRLGAASIICGLQPQHNGGVSSVCPEAP